MSVRVRLTRVGSKKNAVWRVVVADQRSPRDGRIIESLGHYNPQTDPSTIVIDRERLRHWIDLGARPTNTVRKLMRAPDTAAKTLSTETETETESVAGPAAETAPAVEAEPAAETASGTEPAAETAPSAEPVANPEEGDGAPAGSAGSEADAGPSGAAVEPSEEQETAPTDGEAASNS